MRKIFHFYAQPMSSVYIEAAAMYIIWLLGMFLLRGKAKRAVARVGFCLAAVIVLVFTVFDRAGSGKQELIPIPCYSFIEAKTQPEMYRSMQMNIMLFLPFGLSLPFALPEKVKRKFLITAAAGAAFSLLIETAQYIFSLGRSEVDDVIMNTLGALLGATAFLICALLERIIKKKGKSPSARKN